MEGEHGQKEAKDGMLLVRAIHSNVRSLGIPMRKQRIIIDDTDDDEEDDDDDDHVSWSYEGIQGKTCRATGSTVLHQTDPQVNTDHRLKERTCSQVTSTSSLRPLVFSRATEVSVSASQNQTPHPTDSLHSPEISSANTFHKATSAGEPIVCDDDVVVRSTPPIHHRFSDEKGTKPTTSLVNTGLSSKTRRRKGQSLSSRASKQATRTMISLLEEDDITRTRCSTTKTLLLPMHLAVDVDRVNDNDLSSGLSSSTTTAVSENSTGSGRAADPIKQPLSLSTSQPCKKSFPSLNAKSVPTASSALKASMSQGKSRFSVSSSSSSSTSVTKATSMISNNGPSSLDVRTCVPPTKTSFVANHNVSFLPARNVSDKSATTTTTGIKSKKTTHSRVTKVATKPSFAKPKPPSNGSSDKPLRLWQQKFYNQGAPVKPVDKTPTMACLHRSGVKRKPRAPTTSSKRLRVFPTVQPKVSLFTVQQTPNLAKSVVDSHRSQSKPGTAVTTHPTVVALPPSAAVGTDSLLAGGNKDHPPTLYTFEEFLDMWNNAETDFGQTTEAIEDGTLVRAANRSMKADDSSNQGTAQYGRILPEATCALFEALELQQDDCLVDIGHGIGSIVMQAAFTVGCEARGIEVVDDRNILASQYFQNLVEQEEKLFVARDGRNMKRGVVRLRHGSLDDPAHRAFLTICRYNDDDDVYPSGHMKVFINNFGGVFSDRATKNNRQMLHLDHHVAGLFTCMPPGSILVTMHPLELGPTRTHANTHRQKHGMEASDLSSFYEMQKISLGPQKDVVSWSQGGGCNTEVYCYKYTRVKQQSDSDQAVFLCCNPEYCTYSSKAQSATGMHGQQVILQRCQCKYEIKSARDRTKTVNYSG